MTYQDCLDYIYTQLPMFTRVGAAAYKPDLHNIQQLIAAIGNPHHLFKSIHIGGTNGKGSCSHVLAAIMQSHGYKTGLYTSPHVIDFRERIKINGEEIPQETVIRYIQQFKPLIEDIQPSFFEITVAMAFRYFADQEVDIAIIEVGLGGLLDSTNIINPLVSVITNISKDHVQFLGNTIPDIATQKAGIIKPGVPVVIGERQLETTNVFFSKAVQEKAPIVFADEIYQVVHTAIEGKYRKITLVNQAQANILHIETDLLGIYQLQNIKTVLAVCDVLISLDFSLQTNTIISAIKQSKQLTGLKGRFDWVYDNPRVIFDVSHNEAGIAQLVNQLQTIETGVLHIVLACVQDKDVTQIIHLLPKNAMYYIAQAPIPRAMPADTLFQLAVSAHLSATCCNTITYALQQAWQQAQSSDTILVTGSFFNLEEAYQFLAGL